MSGKKKIRQKDAIRLIKKSAEVHSGEREWTDASATSFCYGVPAFMAAQVEGQRNGGLKAGVQKRADKAERNTLIRVAAKQMEVEHDQRTIPGLLAKRFPLSARQIKRILNDSN